MIFLVKQFTNRVLRYFTAFKNTAMVAAVAPPPRPPKCKMYCTLLSLRFGIFIFFLLHTLQVTFQNTESKSAPWNLSGIPVLESLGPSNATNSSKPTWPSPDRENTETDVAHTLVLCAEQGVLWGSDERTVHVQSLDDDLQLHLVGHVAQRTHGRS